MMNCKAIVIGASAGGINAIQQVISNVQTLSSVAIFVVLHVGRHSNEQFRKMIADCSQLPTELPDDKSPIQAGTIYIAPANYHMLIEDEFSIALSVDEPECYSRPSINVTFESAARIYHQHLIGILLSGANEDGSAGLKSIHTHHGLCYVQDPNDAEYPEMPNAALQAAPNATCLSLPDIRQSILSQVAP